MRNFALAFLVLLSAALLASCGLGMNVALFKPHTPTAVKQADLDQCKMASFRAIPQAYATNTVGGFYDPGDMDCHKSRHGRIYCDRVGGYYSPPVSYTEDMNASMRWRFVSACLGRKGYYVLNRPPCASGAERARALGARTLADFTCDPDYSLDY